MKTISIREYDKVHCCTHTGGEPCKRISDRGHCLPPKVYQQLRRIDQVLGEEDGTVFSWHDNWAQAQQWVGVIQTPALQLEILPKIAAAPEGSAALPQRGAPENDARNNLLYMLAVGGEVDIRDRDIANLAALKGTLSEKLCAIFANRLREQLLLGPDKAYVTLEENLGRFRGKLLVTEQIRQNSAHQERFFCRYDEFREDTPLSRLLRATCRALIPVVRRPATAEVLRECLSLLDGVEDVPLCESLVDTATITRQNQRFRPLHNFCRMFQRGLAPLAKAGPEGTFCLLYDMNDVFEQFIAGFMRQEVMPELRKTYGNELRLYAQRGAQQRFLFHKRLLELKPDLVLTMQGPADSLVPNVMVVDTKWKRPVKRADRSDLYQMYAYGREFKAHTTILLYPSCAGEKEGEWRFASSDLDSNDRSIEQQLWTRSIAVDTPIRTRGPGELALREQLRNSLVALVREVQGRVYGERRVLATGGS